MTELCIIVLRVKCIIGGAGDEYLKKTMFCKKTWNFSKFKEHQQMILPDQDLFCSMCTYFMTNLSKNLVTMTVQSYVKKILMIGFNDKFQ